jgi:hypothetical protein
MKVPKLEHLGKDPVGLVKYEEEGPTECFGAVLLLF